MTSTLIAIAAIFFLIAADQITKLLVSSNFEVGESLHIIDGLLDFTYVQNRGAAFGMFANQRWIFLIATVVLLAAIIIFWARGFITHFTGKIAAVLIIAGGVGNMIDRIMLGYVVDFIDISPLFDFAVFNVADCCVCIGAVFLAIYILFFMDDKKSVKKEKASESK